MNLLTILKKSVLYIIAFVLIYYVLYEFFYSVTIYIFIDILNECIVDSYWADCFAPGTKSSAISFLLSIVFSIVILYLFWNRLFENIWEIGKKKGQYLSPNWR